MNMYPVDDPRTNKSKIVTLVVYAALCIIAIAIVIFLYWTTSNTDVLEVRNNPVPIRTIREHPTADGVVILKTDFCKKVSATGRGRISFVSPSREIFLPAFEEKSPKACDFRELPVLIPSDIPSGQYRIRFRIVYQVTPLKQVVEEFDSKEFTIDPK